MKQQRGFSFLELMIALSLGSLLCVGVFHVFFAMNRLHQRQVARATLQENTLFLTQFLRNKIQSAGDNACTKKISRSIVIQKLTVNQALNRLGLMIAPKTNLLWLRECARLYDHQRYRSLYFFVASTGRQTSNGQPIVALFYKIAHHPREELVTGVTHFLLRVYHVPHSKKNIKAVAIYYVLSSENNMLRHPQTYSFNNKVVTARNHALHQPGVLYAARRNAIP
jgi:prepilin-type N-terminal cleavage/methylation domain-containing protein